MLSRSKHLDHLASIPLFSACSKRDLEKIARASSEIEVEAGRVLCEQGDTGREAFVIIEGKAGVKRNKRKIATLTPGDAFGELSLLDHGPRTASVEAETPMTLLVLSAREFTGVLDEVPGLNHKLLAVLASRVRELDSKVFG
jgi:CRP-like cAMP-binding protein